jgi:hypothetical protein
VRQRPGREHGQSVDAVVRAAHPVPVAGQRADHRVGGVHVVVDDENAGHRAVELLGAAAAGGGLPSGLRPHARGIVRAAAVCVKKAYRLASIIP